MCIANICSTAFFLVLCQSENVVKEAPSVMLLTVLLNVFGNIYLQNVKLNCFEYILSCT